MDTVTQFPETHHLQCEAWQCVKGDPKDVLPVPCHPAFVNTIHTELRVIEPESPVTGSIHVKVFNGSKGISVALRLKSTDTIMKVQLEYMKKVKGDFGGSLAYNGKPVKLHQTLAELHVKPGDTFITYKKCHGG